MKEVQKDMAGSIFPAVQKVTGILYG